MSLSVEQWPQPDDQRVAGRALTHDEQNNPSVKTLRIGLLIPSRVAVLVGFDKLSLTKFYERLHHVCLPGNHTVICGHTGKQRLIMILYARPKTHEYKSMVEKPAQPAD